MSINITNDSHPAVPARLLYPVPDAAVLLGISRSSAYKLMDQGHLTYRKVGSRRLIAHSDLIRFVDSLVQQIDGS